MAGYSDTRQLIIDTLMGRPAGTEIQPEEHQAFALALNDYIRNVELNSGNAFIGFAQSDTVPIQSNNGQCFYISTVPPGTNIVYANFIDYEGNPISVTTSPNKMAFVTLIWNTRNWDAQITIIETNWSQIFENNIAPNSIDSSKIIDGTIQSTDLNPNAFDNTLTKPDKIAPADVVGSELTDLLNYINGMEGGVNGFAEDTSFQPNYPEDVAATVIGVGPGTFTNMIGENGSAITVDSISVVIFFKAAGSTYWKYKTILPTVVIEGDVMLGVKDYAQLQGKPSINGKELVSGDNTLDALGIQPKGDYATKSALDAITALIPSTASASNQLADKDFVNSSIATATAEFRGSFTSLDELKATPGNLNDYAFYLHTDDVGNKVVDRYKWTTAGWLYEYTLNNSSFTAEQWAALNSAITATLVQSYNSHLNNSTIHITADERIAWNNKSNLTAEDVKKIKVNNAGHADSADNATKAGSADKLTNSRKIFGLPFDGMKDVVGGITADGDSVIKGNLNVTKDGIFGGEVVAIAGDAEPAGVTNYAQLQGKPSINGKELASGNNTLDALGIQPKGDYTTASQLATTLADYATKVFVSNNYATKAAVYAIQALIPATASADNQLADKDFVNSSIATATAEFKGSFTSLDELKATSGNLNDYAFYLHKDNVGNSIVDRYKWTTAGWLYEYTLNNSSFTAEQWAALNSAITATLVNSYNSHLNNSIIHITATERTKWNNKWDYNEETIKGVKVNAAISADKATKLATARTIWGQNFDGNGDILYTAIPTMTYVLFNKNTSTSIGYIGKGGSADHLYFGGYNGVPITLFSNDKKSSNNLTIATTGNVLIGTTTDNGYKLDVNGKGHYSGDLIADGEVAVIVGEGTPAGVTDYSALTGKPSINGVTLVSGNNTLASLGIQAAGDYATNSGVTTLLANYADKTFVSNNYVGKTAFNNHTADTDIHITAAERIAWNAKWDYNEATIKAVKVTAASSADSVAWSGISGKPTTFTPSAHTHTASEVSGLPTSLKNPYKLTFGSKTYDGSAAATITASDLGALTAHQSIYTFTLQVNGTSKGTYNPTSAAKTINIAVPTKTSDITNDSGFITSASIPTALKNPYAVEIKANGVSLGTYDGSAVATFNLSAANVGAASKVHSHTASDISGLPTNLSAFNNDVGYITGITKSMVEDVLTGEISSHIHSYLPLSGGTISGMLTIKAYGYPLIEFKAGNTTYGYYGFSSTGIATIWDTKNWQTLLHAANYNSYAPTLTGTGASGTWGISITGNAASATKLATARTIWGQSFDGNGNIPYTAIPTMTYISFNKDASTSIGYIGKGGNANDLYFGGYNGVPVILFSNGKISNNLTVATTGNVLIGTRTDNGYKLQVNGSERVYGDLIVDGEVSALVS